VKEGWLGYIFRSWMTANNTVTLFDHHQQHHQYPLLFTSYTIDDMYAYEGTAFSELQS
jgi:hypothetical protein